MTHHPNIIVIGASLGGVDALRRIMVGLPADLPAAVVIVLHTNTRSPMAMVDILGACTAMPVAYVEQDSRIELGRVYVAPPGRHTVIAAEGVLGLNLDAPIHHSRPAADALFQSAAEIYGWRVVGVVLTGGDHDGTDGLRAIKRAGGITVVQSPHDAVDPGMPTNAIYGDSPDHVVPLGRMPALLARLAGNDVSASCASQGLISGTGPA